MTGYVVVLQYFRAIYVKMTNEASLKHHVQVSHRDNRFFPDYLKFG
jgi:hypothetical protein